PGASHTLEVTWAELVRQLVPSAERVRFTSSGTEATLMAVRLARLVTGRTKIIKFAGHFHGWHDAVMPAPEPPHPESWTVPGIPPAVAAETIVVPPNDRDALQSAIEKYRPAAVIHEGNGSRWGTVPAPPEFLRFIREITAATGTVFILDEVITGFRVAPGGFQSLCGIVPDLTTLAKVLAGGLPGGCLAGRADILDALAFDNRWGRKMKHPGTFNANPVSAAAGIAMLEQVRTGQPCEHANAAARQLRSRLNALFDDLGARCVAYGQFSAVKILPEYDGPRPDGDAFIPYQNDWRKLDRRFDPTLTHAFRCALLLNGVDWMGLGGTTTAAHTEDDIEQTVLAFANAIDLLREDGFAI
ncbi:MAG: aminotransferase class III-fold pyridoxal phosphate-dependent enzyme, partial [Planctomycetota bacterium]